jgi:hypothetical protein
VGTVVETVVETQPSGEMIAEMPPSIDHLNPQDDLEIHNSIELLKIREMVQVLSNQDLLKLRNEIDCELLNRNLIDDDNVDDTEEFTSKGCCLAIDESNKLKKEIVLKVISSKTQEKEAVTVYSLESEHTTSKKSSCSSDSTIKSLIQELSLIGFAKITSGISNSATAATRSMELILNERTQDETIETRFDEAIMEKILNQALLYFRDEFIRDGLCLVLITDPMLASYVARALLLVLHRAHFITLSPQELQQCQSAYLMQIPESDERLWTKSPTTHGFPPMSSPAFQSHMEKTNFLSATPTARTKIEDLLVKAYGLCHVGVLVEIKIMAISNVNSRTLFYDDDRKTPWHPGMY